MYGVSKVFNEGLGAYYHKKFEVDFRCLRYPVIISSAKQVFNGTGGYMTEMFFEVLENKHYTCYLEKDTALPALYIDDCVEATLRMVKANRKDLKRCTYNLAGVSMTPQKMIEQVKKIMPFDFTVSYEIDPLRQAIAESWPDSLDDKETRVECFKDWLYIDDEEKLARTIYDKIDDKYKQF
jgi:threonine 3-dehydrogenase